MTRQFHMNAFLHDVGHHESAWRMPQTERRSNIDVKHYQNLGKIAERGKFNSVFFADSPAVSYNPAQRPTDSPDPTILLASIAAVTEHVGLIATASTTYEDPYNLARRFASLDTISGGRAGWNVVTSGSAVAALNFGYDSQPTPEERYERSNEFLEVVLALWNSWDDDAVMADKAAGVYADPAKIRTIDHVGKYFKVRGPLNMGRSYQGHPLIVQAGSSGPGIAQAAAYAEAVFTAQRTIEDARNFYETLKSATRDAGRDPDGICILPGIVPIVGSTETEAKELAAQLDSLVSLELPLIKLAADTNLPIEELDLDAPLPQNVRPVEEFSGTRSRYQLTLNLARRENLTVRELLLRLGSGRGHNSVVGSPEQIADTMEEWFTAGACDGFNVMPPVLPSVLETFVDHVVPILQDRGLFRREYEGTTLRDHYGLKAERVPADLPAR